MIQNDLPSLTGMLPEVPGENAPAPQPIQLPEFDGPKPQPLPLRSKPAPTPAAARPTRKAAKNVYKEEPDDVLSLITLAAHVLAGR